MDRRRILHNAFAGGLATALHARGRVSRQHPAALLWQTADIGDIALTPGMLALPENHRPDAGITL